MRILIVCQYFWPEPFNITQISEGLAEQGHDITVLTGIPNYPQGKFYEGYKPFKPLHESKGSIKIIRLPIISRGSSKGLRLALNYFSYILSGCLLGPWLCRGNYDVIYVYGLSPLLQALPAILLKKLKRIPLVLNVQDLWPESLSATGVVPAESWITKAVAKVVRFIYRRCDKILVQSRGFIRSVETHGADLAKILYFPNFVSDFYQPLTVSDSAPERALLPQGFIVIFAGNIGVAQDFPTVLAAAKQLQAYSDIHFVVLGDGRQKAAVLDQIQSEGLTQVHLLGRFPETQMPQFFALSNVLLVSLADEPIFALTIPSKVQSYLACAKPIVAALNGEGATVIREAKAGVAVNSGDSAALADAIVMLYNMSAAERNALGANALAYSRINFNRTILMKQLTSVMDEVVQK